MARLLVTNGVQQGRAFPLRPGVNRIGRSLDNHFQIPDSSVSSSHCEVILSDSGVVVRDLNSTNGTLVDGEPAAESNIRLGQVLQLGTIELRLEEPPISECGAFISVPDITVDERITSTVLADGSPACANHPEAAALFRCTKCQQTLCEACVRTIRRLGGETLAFCSLCAGSCEFLARPVEAPAAVPAERRTFFGRITQTLKLPFKHRGS